MKLKFQSGGMITYTPVFPQPLSDTTSASSKSTTKKEDGENLLQKEIMKVLEEKGIQSDVNAFYAAANNYLVKSKHLSQNISMGGDVDNYSMSELLVVLQMANSVKQNKELWTSASQKLTNEDAWHEVATTTTGGIYTYDEKKGLKIVSPDEYHENLEKYHGKALTNAQVLGLREQNANLAFNSNILLDMNGAIGMNSITNKLVETVTKFGNVSRSEYIKKTGDSISQSTWDGFQYLIANGPDGYYKATTKSERESVESAIKYLWDSLGADGKKRLRAEAAVSGADPNKNHLDLILQVLEQHTDHQVDPNFDKSTSEYDPDGDGKGGKEQLEDDPYLSVVAKGKGIRERLSLTPSTTSPMSKQAGLKVWGINIGPLVDREGNIIEQTSLLNALQRGEVFRGRPDNNVTFGNKILTPEEQKTIITDESPIVYMVELPYKETINGIVPDFDMVDKYNEVKDLLKNTTSDLQRTELLIKYGIDPSKLTIDEKGEWILKTKMFTRVPGYISEDLVELTNDNKRFMDPVDSSEGNQKRDLFNTILEYGVQNPKKGAESIHSTWGWFGGGDWDRGDMHRGYFYVTAPDEWIAALVTGQNKIDKHLLTDIDKRIYMSRAQQDTPLVTQF